MTYFIGFELLTANALINEMEHNNNDFLSLEKVREYVKMVTSKLDENKIKFVLLSNVNRFEDCAQDYTVDFVNSLVKVNDEVSVEDLRDKYRGPLSYEVLKCCVEVEKKLNSVTDEAKHNL